MKTLINLTYIFICTLITPCFGGKSYISNYASQISINAFQKLRQMDDFLSNESVQDFKQEIEKSIKILSEAIKKGQDKHGDMVLDLEIQKENIKIIECLYNYRINPNSKDAQYLSNWARSSGYWSDLIIKEMNKQKNPKFQFKL